METQENATPPTTPRRSGRHRFAPGTPKPAGSGRVKGQLTRATREVREICEELVSDPVYVANLQTRLKSGKLHPSVEQMLWYYARGKPVDTVQITGQIGIGKPSELTPAELLAELEASQDAIAEYIAQTKAIDGEAAPALALEGPKASE